MFNSSQSLYWRRWLVMENATPVLWQKVVRGIISLVKLVVVVTLFVITYLAGMATQTYVTRLHYSTQYYCFVENAVTVACQRTEEDDFYVWKIVAIKDEGMLNEEVILIQHKIPKFKAELLGY